MILYSSNAIDFRHAVDDNSIADRIESAFVCAFGKRPSPGERTAWNNSMRFMETIIRKSEISDDCGILIEFTIPASSKRVDFIIAGQNQASEDNFVIIELKQWSNAQPTAKEDLVIAYVGKNNKEMTHPSYQAWAYKQMMDDMNTAIQTNKINSFACSYLHNYIEKSSEPLKLPQYTEIIKKAPMFLKNDSVQLQNFLKHHVGKGKGMEILHSIENGPIKPSKKLIDHVYSIFRGNKEFVLLDEQKIAYETILSWAKKDDCKRTIIVKGGPGTGKSVVSINSFVQLLKCGKNVKFVAPNASFRDVLIETLATNAPKRKGRIQNLFSGSLQYYNTPPNTFDVIVIDEAHRLKDASAYQYNGKNQIEDIIKASRVSVFFVDDSQRIRPEDIGSVSEIKRVAKSLEAEVYEIELKSQFRCAGAEGFINWLDTVLQINDTGNFNGWDKNTFEFKIIDSPNDLLDMIKNKALSGWNSRMLAGFSWKWTAVTSGNKDADIDDVKIAEYNFSMPWNSRSNTTLWAVNPEGINQIGCIHTCQGLEFDYVGVVVGADLKFDPVKKSLSASYDDYMDTMGKKGLKNNPKKLTELVCNIYKTLMSRGMKGCFIYCVDKNLQEHFRERLNCTE